MLALAGQYEKLAATHRELAAVEVAQGDSEDTWTSEVLPPDVRTRRAFAEYLREHEVEGARLVGQVWIVPRASWLAARTRKVTAPRLTLVETVEQDDDAIAEAALEAAGLRSTTRRAR